MEEVKCALLGFPSVSLGAYSASPAPHHPTPLPSLSRVQLLSDSLRAQLHPSEEALLESVLPLGSAYSTLRAFTTRPSQSVRVSGDETAPVGASVASGGSLSLYASALRVGVKQILTSYEDAVRSPALCSASALSELGYAFDQSFKRLVELAQTAEFVESCLDGVTGRPGARRAVVGTSSPATHRAVSPSSDSATATLDEAVPLFLRQWNAFVQHEGLPPKFRACIGESVWLSVLFTIAHFVAHGVVLHGRRDFFLQPASVDRRGGAAPHLSTTRDDEEEVESPTLPSEGVGASHRSRTREYTLVEAYVPPGISFDLSLSILATGRERRLLMDESSAEQLRVPGWRGTALRGELSRTGSSTPTPALTSLAMSAQDEVAEAVFHTVFHPSLSVGGRLLEEELAARVDAAHDLWAKALWTKVKDPYGVLTSPSTHARLATTASSQKEESTPLPPTIPAPTLFDHMRALQGFFLCHRGDVWHGFVERVHEVVENASPVARSNAGGGALAKAERNALLHRRAEEAFMASVVEAGLADHPAYASFRLRVAESCPPLTDATEGGRRARTVDDLATVVLHRIEALELHYTRPTTGLGLVVTDKALLYYQRLFAVQLSLRFALRALYQLRRTFAEAIVTNTSPSDELRRAYRLLQTLLFVVSAVRDYSDVDVTAQAISVLDGSMRACKGVEEAKQRHDQFIWTVAEGCFATQGGEPLRGACHEACRCSLMLYLVCQRYGVVYWAVEGVNEVPVEVSAVLTALETRVHQGILAVFLGHLGVASRAAERALWVRLDFNRHFSQSLRAAETTVSVHPPRGGGSYAGLTSPPSSSAAGHSRGRRRSSSAAVLGPPSAVMPHKASAASTTTDTRAVDEEAELGETRGPTDAGSHTGSAPRARTPTQHQRRGSAASSASWHTAPTATTADVRRGSLHVAPVTGPPVSSLLSERDAMNRTSSTTSATAEERARPRLKDPTTPAPSSTQPSTVVFSVPAVRTFAAAAYPGGVAPPSSSASGVTAGNATGRPGSVTGGAQLAAAIAARQAAIAAAASADATTHVSSRRPTTGAVAVVPRASLDAAARRGVPHSAGPRTSSATNEEATAGTPFRDSTLGSLAATAAARASRPRAATAHTAQAESQPTSDARTPDARGRAAQGPNTSLDRPA